MEKKPMEVKVVVASAKETEVYPAFPIAVLVSPAAGTSGSY